MKAFRIEERKTREIREFPMLVGFFQSQLALPDAFTSTPENDTKGWQNQRFQLSTIELDDLMISALNHDEPTWTEDGGSWLRWAPTPFFTTSTRVLHPSAKLSQALKDMRLFLKFHSEMVDFPSASRECFRVADPFYEYRTQVLWDLRAWATSRWVDWSSRCISQRKNWKSTQKKDQ